MARSPQTESPNASLEPVSISRLGTYASCQAKGHLRYVLKEKPPTEGHYLLVGTMLHQAVEDYYKGLNNSPASAVHAIFLQEMEKRGVPRPKAMQAIIAAQNEMELLADFRNGKYKKPDGELYSNPRMTKFWKEQSKERGLNVAHGDLSNVEVKGVKLPDGGLIELASRILDLAVRYERNLLIDRDKFDILKPEIGFDFVVEGVRFLGYMDLVASVKPEHLEEFDGKPWVLIDYKTGKAKDLEVHTEDSNKSMQLSLYHRAITNELGLCGEDELYIALHYVDAQFPAVTHRGEEDFQRVLAAAKHYQSLPKEAGLVKRMFYDSDECKNCELRAACIKHFGMPTTASACASKKLIVDDIDWENM